MKLLNSMFNVVGNNADNMQVKLNADHDIYKAHFPGNPITPGVCIVQFIGELLSDRLHRNLSLDRVVNLKFVSTISPTEDPVIAVCFTAVEDTGTACKAKDSIMSGSEVKTKFSVVFK